MDVTPTLAHGVGNDGNISGFDPIAVFIGHIIQSFEVKHVRKIITAAASVFGHHDS